MKKLILFGDSLFAQCSKSEVLYLEKKLDNKYDVYNCATGGWNTNDLVSKAPFISRLKADVVLISIGTNDAAPWKKVDIEKFKSNLPHIVREFSGQRVIFFPPPPVNETRPQYGTRMNNKEVQEYCQAIIDFCENNNLQYLDSWKFLMPKLVPEDEYHNEDGIHFSDEGYELLLNGLAEVVQNES